MKKRKKMTTEAWNTCVKVGAPVFYWPGIREGKGKPSKTRSEAWDLCGSPVVMVEGHAGGVALTHIDIRL